MTNSNYVTPTKGEVYRVDDTGKIIVHKALFSTDAAGTDVYVEITPNSGSFSLSRQTAEGVFLYEFCRESYTFYASLKSAIEAAIKDNQKICASLSKSLKDHRTTIRNYKATLLLM